MPRFFWTPKSLANAGDLIQINGQDASHIRRSLRMEIGDNLTVCDGNGKDYQTEIVSFSDDAVSLKVLDILPNATEPSLKVTLYQGLPKGDKLETIIQKCVEVGVYKIVPVVLSRSIAKPGDKVQKKQERWQKIADEAAGQSGRGIRPQVEAPISFSDLLKRLEKEKTLICYENGGKPLGQCVSTEDESISLVIGPEGGLSEEEVKKMEAAGGTVVTMGPRILRTETAPIAAMAVLMEKSGNWN